MRAKPRENTGSRSITMRDVIAIETRDTDYFVDGSLKLGELVFKFTNQAGEVMEVTITGETAAKLRAMLTGGVRE